MSRVDQIMQEVKAAAFDMGIPALAKEADIPEDTLRRLLKGSPNAIENLKKLDVVVATRRAATPAT